MRSYKFLWNASDRIFFIFVRHRHLSIIFLAESLDVHIVPEIPDCSVAEIEEYILDALLEITSLHQHLALTIGPYSLLSIAGAAIIIVEEVDILTHCGRHTPVALLVPDIVGEGEMPDLRHCKIGVHMDIGKIRIPEYAPGYGDEINSVSPNVDIAVHTVAEHAVVNPDVIGRTADIQ